MPGPPPDEYHIWRRENVILVGEMRDLEAGFDRSGKPICAIWSSKLQRPVGMGRNSTGAQKNKSDKLSPAGQFDLFRSRLTR
jgi:hypothetical protein